MNMNSTRLRVNLRFLHQLENKHTKFMLIKRSRDFIGIVFHYVVLFSLSFVFLYPLFYMVSKSLMSPQDAADATVQWIPRTANLSNYVEAFKDINYWQGFKNSTIISFGSAVLQVFSCSLIGYGFARYRFPGRGILMALVLFTFLVPPQTIVVPIYIFFTHLNWINTYYPFVFPSLFGHGLKGSLFVLIFIQFYRRMPYEFEEAARIDGAGAFHTYWKIMFPLARPAILVVFLFSVVWHWNDLFEPNMYLFLPQYLNLSQNMAVFNGNANMSVNQMASMVSAKGSISMVPTLLNQIMAAVMLTILPILTLYLFTQRYFVESVERTGIAGE